MSSLNVALIGYGYAGRVFHAPLIKAENALALTVISSTRAEDVRKDFPSALVISDPVEGCTHPDIDLVVIATPNETHAPLAEQALQAGKHVVVDKPFTLTAQEARTLSALAKKQNKVLCVFQNRRWDSDFLAISKAIKAKKIGSIVEFFSEMSRFRPIIRSRWREQNVPGGGLWYDLAPHLLDQTCVLFGLPDAIQTDISILRPHGQSADWFSAILSYQSMRVTIKSSMLAADPAFRFSVRGTEGALVKHKIDLQESQLLGGLSLDDPEWGIDPDPLHIYEDNTKSHEDVPSGNYKLFYHKLAEAIIGSDFQRAPVLPGQATSLMALIEAGLKAAQTGQKITPTFTDEEYKSWQPLYPPLS